MTVKINAKSLGIKRPVEVKESNKNIKLALKLQLDIAKLQKEPANPEDDVANISAAYQVQEMMTDFVGAVLKLSDKQKDALDDLEGDETGDIVAEIVAKLLHLDIEEEISEDGTPAKK